MNAGVGSSWNLKYLSREIVLSLLTLQMNFR